MSNKKIYIYGTGESTDFFLDNGINANVVGYIETYPSKNQCGGIPVYGPTEITLKDEYIVVTSIYTKEIAGTLGHTDIDMGRVAFWNNRGGVEYNHDPVFIEIMGDKNYSIYLANHGRWKGGEFEADIKKYSDMNTRKEFAIEESRIRPFIADKYVENGSMGGYFWQDLWGAKKVISGGVKEHWDIGSRLDGFIAHLLAAGIKVNVIDIRPFPGQAENLYTIQDDATLLTQFEDNSIPSLSALCSIEHFGLGRYGDPIDPEACFKCFEKTQDKLCEGGKLYISLPVGQDRVEFNAHRVFYAKTVLSCFSKLKLLEFSIIEDGALKENVALDVCDGYIDKHAIGLFLFEKQ